MHAFVVAVEYAGDTITVPGGTPRLPMCEHAYDLQTEQLAGHTPQTRPRIAFPSPQRGWNSDPQTTRCPACDIAVDTIVRAIVSSVLTAVIRQPPQ
jgi:hypothetical protein